MYKDMNVCVCVCVCVFKCAYMFTSWKIVILGHSRTAGNLFFHIIFLKIYLFYRCECTVAVLMLVSHHVVAGN